MKFEATNKGITTNFFSPLSLVAVFGSGIRDPGGLKIRIPDKHCGSENTAWIRIQQLKRIQIPSGAVSGYRIATLMLSPDTGELHYLQFEAEDRVLRFNAGHLRHAEKTHIRYIAKHRSSYESEYYILKFPEYYILKFKI